MTSESSLLVRRIVCSLASDSCISAELKWAIALAGHFDATLDVLQIRDAADGAREMKYVAFEDHSRRLMRSLDSYQRFDQLVQAAGESIRVATYRVEAPAVAAILQHAKQSSSDLVILNSSQAVASIGTAPSDIGVAIGEMVGCALLTVQRGEPPPVFQRILLPVDFSAVSSTAIEWAVAISKRFGASIHLLHVVSASPTDIAEVDSTSPVPSVARRAAADARLNELEAPLRQQGLSVSSTSLTHEDIARAIVEQYTDGSCDLIIMGLNAARYPRNRLGVVARIRQNNDVSLLSVGTVTPHAESVRGRSAQSEDEAHSALSNSTG